jgi:ribonuclease HI
MADDVERILEAIAALSATDRQRLFARLAGEDGSPPTSRQGQPEGFATGEMEGPADYVLVFDGGSHGNPGPGYGSYALARGEERPRIVRLEFGEMTNNEAEYETLIAGLQGLAERIQAGNASPADASVEARGDSALVIHQINGTWKAKDDRMRALRNRGRKLLTLFKEHRLVLQGREESVRVLGH